MALKDGALPPTRLLPKPKSGTFQALERPPAWHPPTMIWALTARRTLTGGEALSTLCLQPGLCRGTRLSPHRLGLRARPLCLLWALAQPEASSMWSDSETSSVGSSREAGHRARLSWLQRKAPDPRPARRSPTGRTGCELQPSGSWQETSDSSEPEEAPTLQIGGPEGGGGGRGLRGAKQGIACPQWPSSGAGHTSGNKAGCT